MNPRRVQRPTELTAGTHESQTQVEVDVGVHAGQGVLQVRRAGLRSEREQGLPGTASVLVGRAAGVEVEAGEDAVEALHERRVLEGACCRRCAEELGDVQVHAVELRDTVIGGHLRAEEPHLLDDLRDGGGLVRRRVDRG